MKNLHWFVVAACVVVIVLTSRELFLNPDGRLHAYVLDVGQGDAALLVTPSGKHILIDGGPDLSLLEHLGVQMPFLNRRIDLLVLSHPNLDHLFAFPELLARYDIERVLITGVQFDLKRYEGFLALLVEKHIPAVIGDPARDIDMGDGVVLDTIWPPPVLLGSETTDENDTSIALRVLLRGRPVMLFTGDMEENEERFILASGADIRADVLKVAHHGSRTSTSTGFLLAVNPRVAVISAGRDNSYGHPHREITERLAHFGVKTHITAQEGTAHFVYSAPE